MHWNGEHQERYEPTHQSMVTSVTIWPVADVPAPPAVTVRECLLSMVPARLPATPPEVVVVEPKRGSEPVTPEVTVVEVVEVESPSRYD